MFICPYCNDKLVRQTFPEGAFWSCISCSGRLVNLNQLHTNLGESAITNLLKRNLPQATLSARKCPSCDARFNLLPLHGPKNILELDLCLKCKMIWFDRSEYSELQTVCATAPPSAQLPITAKQATPDSARATAKTAPLTAVQLLPQTDLDYHIGEDVWWKYLCMLAGLPVEHKQTFIQKHPVYTWTLAALILFISLISFTHLDSAIQNFGFIPDAMFRYGGLTVITAFFLHVNILHLLGNLYYLMIFGDNVEDYLGKAHYLALILYASVFGGLLHAAFDTRSNMPLVGASGGISGLITFYCLRFDQAKINTLIFFHIFRVPALVSLALWIFIQVIGSANQISGYSNVSALGHLGGASIGFAFWYFDRLKRMKSITNSR